MALTRTKGTRRVKGPGRPGERPDSLLELTGALMAMVVLPYLGPAAAAKEAAAPDTQSVGLRPVA